MQALPGFREHHRLRPGPGDPESGGRAPAGRRGSVDQAAVLRIWGRLQEGRQGQGPPECADLRSAQRGAGLRPSARSRFLQGSREKEVQSPCTSVPEPVSRLYSVSGLRRITLESRGVVDSGGRNEYGRDHAAEYREGPAILSFPPACAGGNG